MAKTTKIPWADMRWNPWMGCTPASEGCAHCYAKRFWNLHGIKPGELRRTSDRTFRSILSKTQYPSGSRVFVCSISDFFHKDVRFSWRHDAWEMMAARPDLIFLVLTKRARCSEWVNVERLKTLWPEASWDHVWLGVTAENQKQWDLRVGELMRIQWPGKRFVSCEPMLGEIDADHCDAGQSLGPCDECGERGSNNQCEACDGLPSIDWVICGGESGPKARPFDLAWARSLRDQCVEAGVPFFFKQTSGLHPEKMPLLDGKRWAEIPSAGE